MNKAKDERTIKTCALIKYTARRLFVERGYHGTRAQDIAREAHVAHGTFYLHFKDKRACFLELVEEAREELNAYLCACRPHGASMEEYIAATLNALYDYCDHHSGVLSLVLADGEAISADGATTPPLMSWGQEWAEMARKATQPGNARVSYDFEVIGQAIVGALHQTMREALITRRHRQDLVNTLTCFLMRGLTLSSHAHEPHATVGVL